MSNETYWALKRREWAARELRPARRRNVPLRMPGSRVATPVPVEVLEETAEDLTTDSLATDELEAEYRSYRELQAEAKELGIKANQPADKLKKAIEQA